MGSLTASIPLSALPCHHCSAANGQHTFEDKVNYFLVNVPVVPTNGGEAITISLDVNHLRWRTQRNGYCTVEAIMTLICPMCDKGHDVYCPLDAPLNYLQSVRRCKKCRATLEVLDHVIDYIESERGEATIELSAVLRCPSCAEGDVVASQCQIPAPLNLTKGQRLYMSLHEEVIHMDGEKLLLLSGPQFQQIQQSLLSAFPTHSSLAQMVRFGMDINLDTISQGNLSDLVFGLITWAEAHGRLIELVEKAQKANPSSPALKIVAEELNILEPDSAAPSL